MRCIEGLLMIVRICGVVVTGGLRPFGDAQVN